jgi:putative peptide zinc metalloprotease protein
MASAMDILDLSFLSIVEDSRDDYVVGNGQTFINVPGIAVTVIKLLDGTRTVAEVREETLRLEGTDVDVADFISDLDETGLLETPEQQPNLWDKISPRHAGWFFSTPANILVAILVAASVVVLIRRPDLAPIHYLNIATGDSSLAFVLIFAIGSWALVFIHEFSHILAARSLSVHAELSFGTRSQFLVAQTNVTGIWQVPIKRRYRVHLAGMRTDLALLCATICVLPLVHDPRLGAIIRIVTLIWFATLAWQFLFFMRTDIYYAYANLTRSKNLMADAASYLRSVLRKRRVATPAAVRAYAWFLVIGQALGIVYFAAYTVPVTLAVSREGVHEMLFSGTDLARVEAGFAVALVAAAWGVFAFLFLRTQHRRIAAARQRAASIAA